MWFIISRLIEKLHTHIYIYRKLQACVANKAPHDACVGPEHVRFLELEVPLGDFQEVGIHLYNCLGR